MYSCVSATHLLWMRHSWQMCFLYTRRPDKTAISFCNCFDYIAEALRHHRIIWSAHRSDVCAHLLQRFVKSLFLSIWYGNVRFWYLQDSGLFQVPLFLSLNDTDSTAVFLYRSGMTWCHTLWISCLVLACILNSPQSPITVKVYSMQNREVNVQAADGSDAPHFTS